MGKSIVGVYETKDEVIEAVSELTQKGYSQDDILVYTNGETKEYMNFDNDAAGYETSRRGVEEESFLDKLKNTFTEETKHSTTTEEQLKSMGIADGDVIAHSSHLENGKIAVIVDDNTTLESYSDTNVNQELLNQEKSYTGTDDLYNKDTEEERIRLREEQLDVQKNTVQTGEVDIEKTVESRQETVEVPVKKEEVYIEHRSVNQDQDYDGKPINDGETIRVPIREEQIEVTKKPVVTDEVVIGKRTVEETKQVSDTVKKEDLLVDGEEATSRNNERYNKD
ncbi:YsnF/AvaK domain-containing protein [Fictibacillus iocasae]|uniref:YsnF/AvaK domain-containing protein n=1 Tax=Fictibacillus iocasae TaxID=2715437 RepID=A0ABW2NSW5_9BACL